MTFKQALLHRLSTVAPYFLLAGLFFALPGLLFKVESQEGRLLVATEKVAASPAFSQSVVYVTRHDWLGAEGVIINKPGYGGPIDAGKAYVLHSDGKGKLVLEEAGSMVTVPEPALKIEGRVGWGYRQLGKEISKGFWEIRPYSADMVFNLESETIWEAARQGITVPESR